MIALKIGTQEQPVLERTGDNRRIDWGYAYLAAPEGPGVSSVAASDKAARGEFVKSGRLPEKDDTKMPRPAEKDWPVLALAFDLGEVRQDAVARHLSIAYDDGYSIELMEQRLRPYWRRQGMTAEQLIETAEKELPALRERCARFDANLSKALEQAGGPKYERMAVLAYRHSFAAQKIVADAQGNPLMFPKENFSNGCISTVDVIYPAAPIFLYLNTALLKAQLKPVLDYAASPRWKWPFAPHDLGTYPKANGQVYGGGEKTEENQMPVEESANLLLLLAGIAKADGNAAFSQTYWPVITRWAEYLEQKGLDPENQLCTDDFAGHLAHNANLSIKAILALGAYAQVCDAAGQPDATTRYKALAQSMAAKWVPWRTTAITIGSPSTSPALGARNTISCGTPSWVCTFSRRRWPKKKWPTTRKCRTPTAYPWTIGRPTPNSIGCSGRPHWRTIAKASTPCWRPPIGLSTKRPTAFR